ncbi:MAG TPA: hypothetical protein VND93_12960 [Myxococcales bacterium]|jgi:peroxiredoxin|nr:hypothetical protein [Myxococcales bacterium]
MVMKNRVMAPDHVLRVGAKAPALRLPDTTSRIFDLDDERARRRQLLIFYRGHW